MIGPVLAVVIGANAAGKTTRAMANCDLLPPSPFYNADSIAEGLDDANSVEPQVRARALVDREIAERLANGDDLGFESTWSGASRPAIVRDAANRGHHTRAVPLSTMTFERPRSLDFDDEDPRGEHVQSPANAINRPHTSAPSQQTVETMA